MKDVHIQDCGTWIYQGSPIVRPDILSLFGSLLERTPDGDYQLHLPTGSEQVQVDDAPFLGVKMFSAGSEGEDQSLSILTNLDEVVTLGPDHPLRVVFDDTKGGGARCYVTVRPGLEARLTPETFDALGTRGVEHYNNGVLCFGVWSQGTFFPMGCLDEKGALGAAPDAPGVGDEPTGD